MASTTSAPSRSRCRTGCAARRASKSRRRIRSAAGHARARQQRRHARRRRRSRPARRPHVRRARRGRRARHAARSSSSTSRSRPTARPCSTAPPVRRGRPHSAPSPCSSARSARRACARRTPARCAIPTARRRFPAAAIAVEDAERLQRMQNRGTKVRLRLKMEAKFLPDADSANVVGEIRGRERPDEIVVVSGHFDSWDVGTGLDRRWRRVRRDVGSAAADEEAQPAPAPHGARRALHQRGERPRRRTRLPRAPSRAARQPRDDARVRQRRLPADGLRVHRQRDRARDGAADRGAARAASRPIRSAPRAAAPTSGRASRPASCRRCHSRSRGTTS